jgi:phenylacetate-CoA ligase
LAPTSNGTCVFRKIEGRDDDYVILKDGQRVGRLDLAFKKINQLLAAQIIQEKLGEIKVNLIPDKGFTKLDCTQLEQNLRALLGVDCLIKFERIETQGLIRSNRGKFNLVVSQIEKK